MSDKKNKTVKTPVKDSISQPSNSPGLSLTTTHTRYEEDDDEEQEVEQKIDGDSDNVEIQVLERLRNLVLADCSIEELTHVVALKWTLDENQEKVFKVI